MGELRPGDYVIGSNGTPTEVLATFPQGEHETVKVTFTDGAWCHVGWEHLWYVQNPNQKLRDKVGHVMTTRQLVDSGLTRPSGTRGEDTYWYIPMTQPVQFSEKVFPIDPYTMGVMMGDGTFTASGYVTICTDDEIIRNTGANFVKGHETCNYVAYGSYKGMSEVVRNLGLAGKRSWEKHIPQEYMVGSVDQRLALLQGLLDTDGSPIDKGGVEFSSTSEALTDAVVELAQSLGGTARKTGPRITQHQNGDGRPSWRVNVKLPPHFDPFRLQRKLDKWVRPTKYLPIRKMVSAEVVGKEQATCIKVAASDSLYVTRNYVVTHNTVITLTSVAHLISTGFLRSVIIVAPIRVIRLVWRQEAQKWSHTKGLTFSMVTGTKDQRTRALMRPANVYLINYDNLRWLGETLQTYFISKGRPTPFNGIVWDEVSKMKNSTTKRVKAIKSVLDHFDWSTGLTGTPASNGYKDLHGQYLVVDKGVRLGTSKTAFRQRFYYKTGPYKEVAYADTEDTIKKLVGDITLEMSAEDYNPLPDLIVNDIEVEMPDELRARYDQMEREFFLQLDSGQNKEMFNQASLTNACLQFANGAIYPIAGMPLWEPLHELKLDALEEMIDEANGQPILLAYAYRSDAQRILERFKSINPINLTECKSEAALNNAMERWASGDCRLMIAHPACLHPETQVLTEWRGWVRIIGVRPEDRVFDGVEFVSHDGCQYSGYKHVIDLFGITMTPDHKLLIQGEWRQARHVPDTRDGRLQALFQWEKTPYSQGDVREMRRRAEHDPTKCDQIEQRRSRTLFGLYQRHVSSDDEHSNMGGVAWSKMALQRHDRQELRGSGNNHLQRMAGLSGVLSGYGADVPRGSDYRANRREQELLQRELPMGDKHGATVQQAQQSASHLQRRNDALSGTVPSKRVFQDDDYHETESWDDRRRSGASLSDVELRQESATFRHSTQRKAHVYDLVNCGPRNRFLIRNAHGEMFISHNSAGHGIDGLQKNGHMMVWFGLNWSLELYEQFNGRLRRQGQGVPVVCHRILMKDTMDQAQALALDEKAVTQDGLRTAIKEYRKMRGV